MCQLGLQGVRRGHVIRTTIPDGRVVCPLDKVRRQFHADRPNQLWVSDFTYVSTWQGWLYVAFVVDVFARRMRWLAGEQQHANRLRSGCPGASAARSTAEPHGRPDTP